MGTVFAIVRRDALEHVLQIVDTYADEYGMSPDWQESVDHLSKVLEQRRAADEPSTT